METQFDSQMAFSSEIIPPPRYTKSQPAPPGFTQYSHLPPPPQIDSQEGFIQPGRGRRQQQLPPPDSQESQNTRRSNRAPQQEQPVSQESQNKRHSNRASQQEHIVQPVSQESRGSWQSKAPQQEQTVQQVSQESQVPANPTRSEDKCKHRRRYKRVRIQAVEQGAKTGASGCSRQSSRQPNN
jgi:hypothetical protein